MIRRHRPGSPMVPGAWSPLWNMPSRDICLPCSPQKVKYIIAACGTVIQHVAHERHRPRGPSSGRGAEGGHGQHATRTDVSASSGTLGHHSKPQLRKNAACAGARRADHCHPLPFCLCRWWKTATLTGQSGHPPSGTGLFERCAGRRSDTLITGCNHSPGDRPHSGRSDGAGR